MGNDQTENTNIGDIITPVSANFKNNDSALKMANEAETDGMVNLATQGKGQNPDGVQSNFSSTPNLITEKTNNGI